MVKLLFLPHCLNNALSENISEEARKRGYEVYIVPGGSKVKNIIGKYGNECIDKIVGVACDDEIDLASKFLKESGLSGKTFSIRLETDGCKNTSVDLEEVLKIL